MENRGIFSLVCEFLSTLIFSDRIGGNSESAVDCYQLGWDSFPEYLHVQTSSAFFWWHRKAFSTGMHWNQNVYAQVTASNVRNALAAIEGEAPQYFAELFRRVIKLPCSSTSEVTCGLIGGTTDVMAIVSFMWKVIFVSLFQTILLGWLDLHHQFLRKFGIPLSTCVSTQSLRNPQWFRKQDTVWRFLLM